LDREEETDSGNDILNGRENQNRKHKQIGEAGLDNTKPACQTKTIPYTRAEQA
jgi:hypothetical protein